MLKACWRNLLYIIEHKVNVLVECWREGLYLQGITHDLSKFNPKEFIPYTKKFFLDRNIGSYDEMKWKYAWPHHQHKNKHHWEYWVVDPNQMLALQCQENIYLKWFVNGVLFREGGVGK